MTNALSPAEKRRTFATEYAVHQNAAKAAVAAGYSARSAKVAGSRLLQRSDVQALIEQARRIQQKSLEEHAAQAGEQLAEDVIATVEQWVREVSSTYEEARSKGNVNGAARCLQLIGQHLGTLEPRESLSEETARLYEMLSRVVAGRSIAHNGRVIEGTNGHADELTDG